MQHMCIHTCPFNQILGRFLLGFSAVEIVNRQFVVSFLPTCLIVAESARLVQFQVSGQLLGLLIGSSAGSFVQTSSEFNLTLPSIVIQNTASRTSSNVEEIITSGNGRNLLHNDTHPRISSASSYNSAQLQADLKAIPALTFTRSESLRRLSSSNETNHNQVSRLTAANWFMVSLWLIYLIYILFGRKVTKSTKEEGTSETPAIDSEIDINENYNSTDSSVSDQEAGHATLLQNSSKFRDISVDDSFAEVESANIPENTKGRRKGDNLRSPKRKRRRKLRTFTKRIRKLIMYSIAIPVSLVFIVWTVFAQEVLFSSCALITKSYFSWRGSATGLFLASLWVILLPMDYCCEYLARRYEERFTVRVSLVF